MVIFKKNFKETLQRMTEEALEAELDGRAILIGGQTSDTHVTAKLEP